MYERNRLKLLIKILSAFILLSLSQPMKAQDFDSLSLQILQTQIKTLTDFKINEIKFMHKLRLELYQQGFIDFVNNSDTIWLTQNFSTTTGDDFGMVWSSVDCFCYGASYINDTLKIESINKGIYSNAAIPLLESWKIDSLYKQSVIYKARPNNIVYGTMVIKNSDSYKIKTTTFWDFIDAKVDLFNLRPCELKQLQKQRRLKSNKK